MLSVIIAGGLDSNFLSNIDLVELVDAKMKCKIDPLPLKLSGAQGVDGMICGGRERKIDSYTYDERFNSKCWSLNPNGTWTEVKPMNESRAHFALIRIANEVFAIGGISENKIPLATVEKCSIKKGCKWSRVKDAPRHIHGHYKGHLWRYISP